MPHSGLQTAVLTLAFALLLGPFVSPNSFTGHSSAIGSAAASPTGGRQEPLLTKRGRLFVMWGDRFAGVEPQATHNFLLVDDEGTWTDLQLDEATESVDELFALNRRQVKITGSMIGGERRTIKVQRVEAETAPAAAAAAIAGRDVEVEANAVTGPQRWVTLLCRFADSTATTPKPTSYFESLMGSTSPGLGHYWREVSYQRIDLSGSATAGWYNLPRPRSDYVYDRNGDGTPDFDFERAVEDCTTAADADVYFPNFSGVNFMFNQDLDGFAHGGGAAVSKDGSGYRVVRATFLPPWAYGNQSVMAHEMGHGFGLPHSSGPYGQVYDSQWDPMSNTYRCSPPDENLGCVGPHTISYHKDILGWIAPARKFTFSGAGATTIRIESLGQPAGSGYLMAQIPIGGSVEKFYTIESRRFAGYDGHAPGEALVIHRVETGRAERAQVVDADGNGNPNDGGAMWTIGETFSDPAAGIFVSVISSDAAGLNVSLTTAGASSISGVQFDTAAVSASEGAGQATFYVRRTGDASSKVTVHWMTLDDTAVVRCDAANGTAYARCDYATAFDTLSFAPGEALKPVTVPLIDDAHVEGPETVQLRLSNPTDAALGGQNVAALTINDNDAAGQPNPVLTAAFFVRMQYLDFLSREPETGEPWSSVLDGCPDPFNLDPGSQSAQCDRILISSSFFGSPEFRLKGFYVFLFYRIAFGRLAEYAEIIPDQRSVTGQTSAEVYQRRAAFPASFVARPEFRNRYDTLSNAAYVNALLERYHLPSITTPDPQQPESGAKLTLTRADLVNRLNGTGGTLTRAQVLRAVVESDEVGAAEFNHAFVAMQYYGYLRRTPETDGYQAWLNYLRDHPGDSRTMVNGFVNSAEYRLRFGTP